MRQINRSALVPYDPESAFNLVDDVANYASFLPWCTESRVDSRSQHLVEATLVLAGPGVKQSFSTANQRFPYERIKLRLLNGPLIVSTEFGRSTDWVTKAVKSHLTFRLN